MTKRAAITAGQATTANARHGGPAAVSLLLLAAVALYGAGLGAASVLDGQPFTRTVCFDPAVAAHAAPARLVIAAVMAVGAILLLFATPWMLGTLATGRVLGRRATAAAWSLAANSAALILACLVLRNTPAGISRGSFLAVWLAWNGLLLLVAWRPASTPGEIRSLCRRWGPGLLIGLATVILGITLFRREQFVQCFNGDGTGEFELARSLRNHFLPYWEIETLGRFGTVIVNPSLISSYWTCALQLLLGEGELAARLPFWVWWMGIFAVALSMVRPRDAGAKWLPAIPLAMAGFLAAVWYTFYVGYYPYMADLGSPGVADALYTLLLLLALDCLRQKDLAGWVVLMALGSLVLYAGPVMFVLTAAATLLWQPVPRGPMLKATLAGALAAVGIASFYVVWSWLDGSLEGFLSTLQVEYFEEYFGPAVRWRGNLFFAGYFLLGCGAVPMIGLLLAFWRKNADRSGAWDRTVATVALAYWLIIMGSGYKNLHYLGPLLPIPLILWLRLPQRPARPVAQGWATALLAAGGLAVSLFVCWPASRPVFTLNRHLGALTTFQTDSYEEACYWARMDRELYDTGSFGWFIGRHTWVHYSQLDSDPAKPRPFLVTDGAPPRGEYQLVLESAHGAKLYCRDPEHARWAAEQRPPSGPDRCPRVFQPIAVSPFLRSGD